MQTASDPELEATELTYRKIARDSLKAGYREGADEARQQNYQQFFDKGYEQGLLNGFSIGILKAETKLHSHEVDISIKNELSVTRHGMCLLCKDNDLLEAPIEDIEGKQKQFIQNSIALLENK